MPGSIADPRAPPNGPDRRIEVEIEKSEHGCYGLVISGDAVIRLSVNRTVVFLHYSFRSEASGTFLRKRLSNLGRAHG